MIISLIYSCASIQQPQGGPRDTTPPKVLKMEPKDQTVNFTAKKVVIELKSVEALNDIHLAQTLTYLRHSEKKLGLLINFNVPRLKEGIRRVINGQL